MFLSGVEVLEESAAIAEGGDSGGGLSKIAGRPVREARPKAADVRREKAVRGGAGKWETDVAGRSGVEWSGKAELGHSPVSLQLAIKTATRPEVVLVHCEKHVHTIPPKKRKGSDRRRRRDLHNSVGTRASSWRHGAGGSGSGRPFI